MQYAMDTAGNRHTSSAASSNHYGNRFENAVPVSTIRQPLQQDIYGPTAGTSWAMHDNVQYRPQTSSPSQGTFMSRQQQQQQQQQRVDIRRPELSLQPVGVNRSMTSPKAGPVPLTIGQVATRKRPQLSGAVATDNYSMSTKSSPSASTGSLRVPNTEKHKTRNGM